MPTIDNLDIQISATAEKASKSIDKLVEKLGELSNSLGNINSTKLMDFSNSLDVLSQAMKRFKDADVKASNFKTIATGIGKFANIDATKISNVGNALKPLSDGVNILSTTSFDNKNLQNLINSLTSLSNANVNNLKNIDFTAFGNSILHLANTLSHAPKIQQWVISMTNAIANLAKSGNNINLTVTALPQLSVALRDFIQTISNVPQISDITIQFTQALGNLANSGAKAQATANGLSVLAVELKQVMQNLSTAPNVSQNVIQMTNALADLASQGGKVGTAANTLSGQLNKYSSSADKATKKTRSLASVFGTLYANFFWVIRGAKALYNSIDSTSDYIEAFNYYNVAFDKVASDWSQDYEKYGYENAEAYADSFTNRMNDSLGKLSGIKFDEKGMRLVATEVKNLGLNIQKVTQFAAQLASVTNSVGLTGEASLAAADSFTKLAGDISSLFNIDYKTAANNLQSGLIGQSRALYKYGIDITNATLQTYAYNLGLSKTVTEMTQAEKMQLRMIAILDQSRVSWGDLANTINQPANAMRVLKAQAAELSQLFGQLFIPVLNKVIPILTGITIALKRLVSAIAGFFGIKIDYSNMAQGFNDMETETGDLAEGFDDVTKSAKKAQAGLRAFDELKTINMPDTTSMGDIGGAGDMIDLTDEILKATSEYEKVWQEAYDRMENVAEQWADKIEKVFEPVKEFFQNLLNGNWAAAGKNFSDIISGIFNTLANAIASVDWEYVGTAIGEFIRGIDWFDIFSSIGRFIWEALNAGIELYKGMFNAAPIETIIMTAIGVLGFTPLGKLVAGKIIGAITKHLTFGKIGEVLLAGIKGIFGNKAAISALSFMDKIAVGFTGVASIITGTVMAVVNFFDMWNNGWNLFNEILKDVGIALAAVGAVILGVAAAPAAIVAAIVAALSTIAVLVHDNWEAISKWFSGIGDWFSTNVITPIVETFSVLWEKVSNYFVELWDGIVSVWNGVSGWFNTNVIEPVVSFFQGLWTRVQQIFEGLWIIVQAVWKVASEWFNENVVTPVTSLFKTIWTNVSNFFKNLWEDIKNVWKVASEWFNDTIISPITNAFKVAGNAILNFFTGIWNGIKKGLSSAMNAVISGIESGINFIVNGINNIIKGFNKVVSWAAKIAEVDWGGVSLIPTVSLPRISGYATGGFPQTADLFYANENGIPELVGTVGGRTAVASGTEITGITDAVYATGQTEAGLLQTAVGLLQVIADKEYGISSDAIFKSVQKSAQNYSKRTGRLAFSG